MKRFVLSLVGLLLATGVQMQLWAAGQAGNSLTYRPSMYPAQIQAEIGRWQVRKQKEKDNPRVIKDIEVILKAADELLKHVQMKARMKEGLKGQQFLILAGAYHQAKQKVMMDMELEHAHLASYINSIKGRPENDEEVKFWEKVLVALADGVKNQKLGNNTRVRQLQAEVLRQHQWVEQWKYKKGSFRNMGPDTHRGDSLLRRYEQNPYVTGVNYR